MLFSALQAWFLCCIICGCSCAIPPLEDTLTLSTGAQTLLIITEGPGSCWASCREDFCYCKYWSIRLKHLFPSCLLATNSIRQEPAREMKRIANHWSCPKVNSWVRGAIVCTGSKSCSRLASLPPHIPHCLLKTFCVTAVLESHTLDWIQAYLKLQQGFFTLAALVIPSQSGQARKHLWNSKAEQLLGFIMLICYKKPRFNLFPGSRFLGVCIGW